MDENIRRNNGNPDLKLEELIDIKLFQKLQDDLNRIYPFPSSIIDNDGVILTATAWQDICTKFHRKHPDCEKECIKSDKYIVDHIAEADPAVIYTCPQGLTDTAMPIIVDGRHMANFFTGQFFLEKPDPEFFRLQAKKYGFDEKSYLAAMAAAPVIDRERMELYHDLLKTFTDILIQLGQEKLAEIENIRALRKNEEKYHSLFESMAQGVFYQEADGRLIDVNPAALGMFGVTRDEFMGRTSYNVEWRVVNENEELLKPEEHPSMIALLSGKPVRDMLVGVYNPKKKKKIWMIANAIPKFSEDSDNPVQVAVSLQDITNKREAETALRRSEERHRLLMEHSGLGIGYFDTDGNILSLNRVAISNIGGEGKDYRGMNMSQIFGTKAGKQYIKRLREAASIREPLHYEEFVYMEGAPGWYLSTYTAIINDKGEVDGIQVISNNITEMKLAEEALKKSEAALSEAQHIAKTGSWEWDMVTNRVTWSKEMFNVMGIDHADFDGNPESMIRVIHPDDIDSFRESMKANREGGNSHSLEYRIIQKDGSVRFVYAIGHSDLNSEGKPFRRVGTVQDITDRKEAEEQLRKHQEILKQKIGELERFNNLTVNRELKMIELKEEINALLSRLGEEPRYRIAR